MVPDENPVQVVGVSPDFGTDGAGIRLLDDLQRESAVRGAHLLGETRSPDPITAPHRTLRLHQVRKVREVPPRYDINYSTWF